MRRLFWVGVGAAAAGYAMVRGRRAMARLAPDALAGQLQARAGSFAQVLADRAREARAEFTVARADRERELYDALLAEGQEDPAVVRARRAAAETRPAGRHSAGAAEDWDEDEELLGYSF